MEKSKRINNFAFILYQDSLNPDWKSILRKTFESVLYVLHDKDVIVDKETGEVVSKKPHYHVLVMYKNARSINTAMRLSKECGCANDVIEHISNSKGYARYLCHLDDPEKHQYDISSVGCLGGANYRKIANVEDEFEDIVMTTIRDMLKFIDDNKVHIYADFVRYCANKNTEWFKVLISAKGRLVKDYIKSEAFAFREENPRLYYRRLRFSDELEKL